MAGTMPLGGIYVVEYSSGLAGRLAGLLLADQGATVAIGRERHAHDDQPLDAFLDRGKVRQTGRAPSAAGADVVIGDGLFVEPRRQGQTRLAVTAVLPGEADYVLPDSVGDDVLKAIVGLYTDLSVTRKVLGDEALYTPLPICSVYAGVLGAVAVCAALAEHAQEAAGRDIVISRVAAGLAAVGALLVEVGGIPDHLRSRPLIALPDQLKAEIPSAKRDPAHFEWLKRQMSPFLCCYPTADHRFVMFASAGHRRQARRKLEILGIWKDLEALGVVDVSPYDRRNAAVADRNIGLPYNLRADLRRLVADRIAAAIALRPAADWERTFAAAGVPCAMARSFDEWRNWDEAQKGGLAEKVPGCAYVQLGRAFRLQSAKPYPPLRLAATRVVVEPPPKPVATGTRPVGNGPLAGLRVLDLANVIAGPACGRVLAELGAQVIKVDATRTDLTPGVAIDWAGELNQGKRSVLLDVATQQGRAILHELVRSADMVVFNRLDPALARMGLDGESLRTINPKAIAVQMTAFKGERPTSFDAYPGYDPILQAQTGIMTRFGSAEGPELHGLASCVDYLCGYLGALSGIVALAAQRRRGDGAGDWADTSLANAATLIQLPFLVDDPPVGGPQRLRKASDGWICAEAANLDFAGIESMTVEQAVAKITAAGGVAARVQSLADLKARHRAKPSATIAFRTVAGAISVLTLKPTWFHFDGSILPETSPPTPPGSDAGEILAALGRSPPEIAKLVAERVVGQAFWAPPDDVAGAKT